MMDALGLAQGTAYTYVNRLVDAGVLEATTDDQPRTYVARDIDLTITAAEGPENTRSRQFSSMPSGAARPTMTSIHTSIGTESRASRRHSPIPSTGSKGRSPTS